MVAKIRTLDDYYPLFNRLSRFFIDNFDLEIDPKFQSLLEQDSKLITVLNHGPLFGPLAYTFVPLKIICESGNGHRSHISIAHRLFYKVPILKSLMKYISQLDKGVSFNELIEIFKTGNFLDFFVMPEGDNCNFGNGKDIQPFKSPRFIEMAILTGCPLLLVVQQGAEHWAYPVKLNDAQLKFFSIFPKTISRQIKRTKTLSIPTLPRKLSNLRVHIKVYEPKLKLSDLSEDKVERMQQLWSEADQVRKTMQKML